MWSRVSSWALKTPSWNTAGIVLAGGLGLVATEHVLRKREVATRPSTLLAFAAEKCEVVAVEAGKLLGRLSNVYDLLGLQGIEQTVEDLARPAFRLVAAPTAAAKGYWNQLGTYTHTALKVGTTAALLGGAAYAFVPTNAWTVLAAVAAKHQHTALTVVGVCIAAAAVRAFVWPSGEGEGEGKDTGTGTGKGKGGDGRLESKY